MVDVRKMADKSPKFEDELLSIDLTSSEPDSNSKKKKSSDSASSPSSFDDKLKLFMKKFDAFWNYKIGAPKKTPSSKDGAKSKKKKNSLWEKIRALNPAVDPYVEEYNHDIKLGSPANRQINRVIPTPKAAPKEPDMLDIAVKEEWNMLNSPRYGAERRLMISGMLSVFTIFIFAYFLMSNWIGKVVIIGCGIILAATIGNVFCGYACPIGLASTIMENRIGKKYRAAWLAKVNEIVDEADNSLVQKVVNYIHAEAQVAAEYPFDANRVFFWVRIITTVLVILTCIFKLWALFSFLVVLLILINIPVLMLVNFNGFCRYFCAYGGILSSAKILSPVALTINDNCTRCGDCHRACPMHVQLIPPGNHIDKMNCTTCGECIRACKPKAIGYAMKFTMAPAIDQRTTEKGLGIPEYVEDHLEKLQAQQELAEKIIRQLKGK